ncbi:unnamed protein product [Polarella glacialis]|nr:unnamed protein product [Polarella glacialis]
MAISEQTVVNAELMAIEEINAAGGLLGQRVVPVIADGESNWDKFAEKAEEFTSASSSKYVKAVFGCWTSASRKAVLPVFEKNNHMLFYPVQYEGQECSKNIFYTGAAPNQQAEPAVDWLLRLKSDKFFLVGSDYVYPRTANAIVRGQLAALGGTVAGEMYLALGEKGNGTVGAIVEEIQRTLPNGGAIINTLNGDSNVQFFHMFYDAGLRPDKYPIMSFSITETEISVIGVNYLVGHYAAWNYFQSTKDAPYNPGGFDPTPSQEFVANYRALYGQSSLVNDPMEAAYIAVHLWAQGVSLAGTFDLEAVRSAVVGQAFPAPEGEVTMQANHHLSKFVRIGQTTTTGDFKIVYESTRAVFPEPWNTWVSSSRGHACDWRDPVNLGGFYQMDAVEVALVHALTGPRASLEKQHLEAEIAAIKTLNRNGGVKGKTILFTVVDGASNDATVLSAMVRLAMDENGSVAIFGRSPSDQAYSAAVAGTRSGVGGPPLVFSPQRSFGGECAEQVVHMGSLLNQQLWPALQYFSQRARAAGQTNLQLFIVASDSVPSKSTDALKVHIGSLGDQVAGTARPSSAAAAVLVAAEVQAAMPAGGVVVNLLEDLDSSKALVQAMRDRQMPAGAFPVLFTGISETDINIFGSLLENQFVSLVYFAGIGTQDNSLFLSTMQEWYGIDFTVTDHMAAAYEAVMFWAKASEKAKTFSSRAVQEQLWASAFQSPAGSVQLRGSNYLAMPSRIGTLNARGTGFRVIADTAALSEPDPFWLEPGNSTATECDFMVWLRLLCSSGQGLVDGKGTSLLSRTGAVGCSFCPAGRYSAELAPGPGSADQTTRVCTACPAGKFGPEPGVDVAGCKPCSAGSSAPQSGAKECQLCLPGGFAGAGQATCDSCASVLRGSDSSRGSASRAECSCPAETYQLLNDCVVCPEGMFCLGASERPRQKAGYWASEETSTSSYSVVLCRNKLECPDGTATEPIEHCAEGRVNVACNNCKSEWSKAKDGRCEECGDTSALAFVGPAVAAVVFAFGVTILVRNDVTKQDLTMLTVLMIGGQLVSAVQALGAIRSLSIKWVQPVKTVMDLLVVIISFDFEILNVSCFLGSDNPVTRFAVRLLVYPFIAASFMVAFFASKLTSRPSSLDSVFNINGILLATLFITLTFTVLLPFQCMRNPNGSAGLVSEPGVMCGNSDIHTALVILGVIGILVYPVAILGWALWVTLMYPSRMASGQGLQLVRRYRFLFSRFKPSSYYYGFVNLFRGFLVALTPIALIEAPAVQIIVLGAVFMMSATVQAWTRPWRTDAANISDILINLALVTILLGVAPLLEVDQSEKEGILGGLVTAVMFFGLATVFGIVGYTLAQRFLKSKGYDVFLCHHKGAAAVLCRFIKMTLTRHSRGNVFLDSDQLEDLDLIFDAVKCQTKHLVVVLTPQLLTRMWCAGEIVSAHRNSVPIVPLICPGYEHPDQSQIEDMPSVWSEKQKGTLANFGITMEMVKDAYIYLTLLPALPISRFGSVQEQESSIVELSNLCKMSKKSMVSIVKNSKRPRILITGCVADAEAMSTCMVTKVLMQQQMQVDTAVVLSSEEMAQAGRHANYFVVILSKGMLRDPAFANMLLTAGRLQRRLEIVTINADSGFEFPGVEFYSELAADGLGSPGLGTEVGGDLVKEYQSLLSVLALPLSPQGSQGLLDMQVSEVIRRFRLYATRESGFAADEAADAASTKPEPPASLASVGSKAEPCDELVSRVGWLPIAASI